VGIEFGYREITILHPLRLRVVPDVDISELKPDEQTINYETVDKKNKQNE